MELLEAVRGGDTAAFGTLYRRHSAAARCLARQIVQSEDAVEDLLVETFARVLEVVRRGGGPASAFRPYLLASLRRYAAAGVADLADGDSLYVDPELAGLERSPLARAYRSLPERWRMLLWHVEIEGGGPADAAPLLGLSGRAAAQLTRKARKSLREAYVRLHLENDPRAECRPILSMILRYVDNGLPKQEAGMVDAHVAECIDCRSVFLQMVDLTQELRAVVGQLVAGPAVDDYLADLAAAGSRSYAGVTGRTGGHGPDGRVAGGVVARVGGRARARLKAVRHHMKALTSRANAPVNGAAPAGRGPAEPAGRARGRTASLLRKAYGRVWSAPRRAWAKAGPPLRAAAARVRRPVSGRAGAVWAKAGPVVARVAASVRLATARVGAVARVVAARVAAVPARLSAVVRSVPTPQRAVLGGIAVAGLATAAFLLVARPAGMLPAGGSGDGTRALDRPRSTGSAASQPGGAVGHAAQPANPGPSSAPRSAPATGAPGAADGSTPADPAEIALGIPEITGKVTPGADPAQESTAQKDSPRKGRKDTARDAPRSLPGFGRVEKGRPDPRRGRGDAAHAGRETHTGRESGRPANAGQSGERADGRPAGEPVTVAALAGAQGSRHADTTSRTAPERQRVRGQLSRHQERHEHVRARSGGQSGVRRAPGAAGAQRESQAGRPATGHAPLAGPGDARHRPGDHGRAHAPATGRGAAALAVAVDPLGALLRGQSGLVAVRLRNAGDAATGEVTATVTLPPGVRYLKQDGGRGRAAADGVRQNGAAGGGRGRADDGRTGSERRERASSAGGAGDGWSCAASGRLVRCAGGPLAPGEVTAIFLRVAVAADAPTGRSFTVRVRSGRLETTAKSTAGVRASGAAARFAADGRLAARVVGNALVSAAAPAASCGSGEGARAASGAGGRGPNSAVSVPVDLDKDPATRTSSCADLDLPAGGRVLWAGLYWSGDGRRAVPAQDIRVRAPGMPGYVTVPAAEIARRDLPSGSGYQAFADVTSLVRAAGGGRWWVAGAPARPGTVRHAAWGLVVMATDERQPYTRAVVLDAAAVVESEGKALRLPLDGLAQGGAPARIDLMLWNGEGVTAGVVTAGDGEHGAGSNRTGVLDGGDAGGVAVDTLHALLGPHPALQLATRRDPVFFGVAVVSARTWS